MKQKKILVAFVLSLCTFTVVQAQENEFDLGNQRSEIQSITPVPGKKIDHHGLVINPTPRHLRLTSGNTVDISAGVHLSLLLWMLSVRNRLMLMGPIH